MNPATSYAIALASQLQAIAQLPAIKRNELLVDGLRTLEISIRDYGERVERVCNDLTSGAAITAEPAHQYLSLNDIEAAGKTLNDQAIALASTIRLESQRISAPDPSGLDTVANRVAEIANSLETSARTSVDRIKSVDFASSLGFLKTRRLPDLADIIQVVDRATEAGTYLREAAKTIGPKAIESASKATQAAKNAASRTVDASLDLLLSSTLTGPDQDPASAKSLENAAESIEHSVKTLVSLAASTTAEAGRKLFDAQLSRALDQTGLAGKSAEELFEMLGDLFAGIANKNAPESGADCPCGHDHSHAAHTPTPQEAPEPDAAPGSANEPTADKPARKRAPRKPSATGTTRKPAAKKPAENSDDNRKQ